MRTKKFLIRKCFTNGIEENILFDKVRGQWSKLRINGLIFQEWHHNPTRKDEKLLEQILQEK